MALVHDLAEAIVGDMTPECGVSADDKHRIEQEAMDEICKLLPDCRSTTVHDLFTEYMHGDTKEAQLVKQLDKLEFLVQSAEYERKRAVDLEEFFKNTRHMVKKPFLVDLMVAVEEERNIVKRDQSQSKPWKK